jgi:hypothetical protein
MSEYEHEKANLQTVLEAEERNLEKIGAELAEVKSKVAADREKLRAAVRVSKLESELAIAKLASLKG